MLPFAKKRRKNTFAHFGSSSSPNPPQMALTLRPNPWANIYADPFGNVARSYDALMHQKRMESLKGMRGVWGRGMYGSPYQRSPGIKDFGKVHTPHAAYGAGFLGGHGGYEASGRRPSSPRSRFGLRANQFRYPSRSTYNYGRDYRRFPPRYRSNYHDFSSSQLYRSYPRNPYFEDDNDYISDDDYESELEEPYYPSPYGRLRHCPYWDGDDDDMWEEDEFDLDEDDDGDFEDYGFNADSCGYEYDRYDRYDDYRQRHRY